MFVCTKDAGKLFVAYTVIFFRYDFFAISAVFSALAFLAFAVFGVQHLSPLLLATDLSLQQDLPSPPCANATPNETAESATTATNERSAFIKNSFSFVNNSVSIAKYTDFLCL
jgi:hypothetical protein